MFRCTGSLPECASNSQPIVRPRSRGSLPDSFISTAQQGLEAGQSRSADHRCAWPVEWRWFDHHRSGRCRHAAIASCCLTLSCAAQCSCRFRAGPARACLQYWPSIAADWDQTITPRPVHRLQASDDFVVRRRGDPIRVAGSSALGVTLKGTSLLALLCISREHG